MNANNVIGWMFALAVFIILAVVVLKLVGAV